jgi:hypothetical protein
MINFLVFIDFIHKRFAFVSKANLKSSYLDGFSFVPMDYRDGQFFISISLNDASYPDDFFYDSGSSLFPLITRKSFWKQNTDKKVNASSKKILDVNRWGSTVEMIGAPMHGNLLIGKLKIRSPMIYFQKTDAKHKDPFDNMLFPVKGIIGNAPFYDCCIVVLDEPHQRFGIIKLQ